MDDLTLIDVWRIVLMAVALWLAALVGRLTVLRARALRRGHDDVGERTHPLVMASYALTLIAIVGFRPKHFGEGLTPELVMATVIVATGVAGVMLRVRLRRPGQRR